jgi:hypothetical protein
MKKIVYTTNQYQQDMKIIFTTDHHLHSIDVFVMISYRA